MAKRKQPEPSEAPKSTVVHGPARPAQTVCGVARLRAALRVSDAVAVDDLCEEAAQTIEKLREDRPKRLRWRGD